MSIRNNTLLSFIEIYNVKMLTNRVSIDNLEIALRLLNDRFSQGETARILQVSKLYSFPMLLNPFSLLYSCKLSKD